MIDQNWSQVGDEIRKLVQTAVDSGDFGRLNEAVGRTVQTAMDSVGRSMSQAGDVIDQAADRVGRAGARMGQAVAGQGNRPEEWLRQRTAGQEKQRRLQLRRSRLYGKTSGLTGGGVALSVIGYLVAVGLGVTAAILLAVGLAGGFPTLLTLAAAFLPFAGAGGITGVCGTKLLSRAKRFKAYVARIGDKEYCAIPELALAVGKSKSFVVKDIQKMIGKGLFLEGHLDQKGTCLIASNEMYDLYLAAEKEREQQLRLEEKKQELGLKDGSAMTDEARALLEEGNAYLKEICACNRAIPGEEISGKISRMETIVQRILRQVELQPDLVDDLHQFMEYYLPTTVKLLKAYEEMDAQPVGGEYIKSSKKEIEDTLDTINQAFENLLDGFFRERAWDISSDISVLQSMLAQDGLTDTEFSGGGSSVAS